MNDEDKKKEKLLNLIMEPLKNGYYDSDWDKLATEGVDCKKDESVLDETPMAYKDIDEVMEYQKDLVEKVYMLKQFICIKG